MSSDSIAFFPRFKSDILAGRKTITIRDEPDSHYEVGSVLPAYADGEDREFCRLRILSVEPVLYSELSETHAAQENMTFNELKVVIGDIYPGLDELFVVKFELAG
jgi:uncharacterized protein YqfB (UPF0267 family)